MIKWRNIRKKTPVDEQDCLTQMMHGVIQGNWNSKDKVFRGYYGHALEWNAYRWVPIEEVTYEGLHGN